MLRWGPTSDGALLEIRLHGTLGGRPLAWEAVDRFVLSDGKIAARHSYFDPLPLGEGHGALPAHQREALAQPHQRKEEAMTSAEKAAWRSPDLGTRRELDLPQGRINVFESGHGSDDRLRSRPAREREPLAQADRTRCSRDFHCVALDLPLGSHLAPIGNLTDPTPPAWPI